MTRDTWAAAGGFESLDATYQRIEASASMVQGAEAAAKGGDNMVGLTAVLNKLVATLENLAGGQQDKGGETNRRLIIQLCIR